MKYKLLIVLLFFTISSAIAQVSYNKRIEFELKDGYINEKIIEFGKDGFLICSENIESFGKESEWKYELFNSNLESVNTKKVLLNKKYRSVETYNTDKRTHTLYKDRKGNFSIVSVEATTLKVIKVDGMIPKKSSIREMAILGDFAFFNTSIKREAFLLSVNWKTGKKNYIPIRIKNFNRKNIFIDNFQVLEKANEIFVYVKVQLGKKESDIYIVRLNENGEKEDVFNLSENINKNIVSISASAISNGKYIFTGTYSTKHTDMSEGIFFCKGQKSEIDFIKFYNFTDLSEFLTYLPKRRQEKIIKKKNRKAAKGKELKINYRIADHDVILLNDGYLLLGEAYYPTTTTTTYTTTSTVNGHTATQTHTRTVFDGYKYTHAVLAKFNNNGDLLWDKTFEMLPAYKPFTIKRFISIAEKNENMIKMVFANKNNIVSKSIGYNGFVIQDVESELIETGYKGDKSKHAFTNIDYWYDNYFLAYGNQTIKNKKDKNVKRKRKVYFISKIQY